ncbi:MAG TPA: Bax inhibitor-1/YccA family protein [Nocardioides sp.]|nr:Bax inhibitor-1/YccA family protein [Nocardioides sp.]
MQSNNPVFRRSEAFNGQVSGQGTNAYGNQTYPGNGAGYQGYGQAPGYDQQQSATPTTTGRPMTIDSVVQKTGIALAVVIVFATITWWYVGDISHTDSPDFEKNLGLLYGALMIGSFGAFGLSLVNSFKRVVSPALVIAFCALEGVALGALSKFFDAQFGDGIVTQAVIGTFAAFAGTLAAYKFFNIQVGNKFRTFVIAAMFGMVGLGLLEMVLGAFGNQLGLFGFGGIGLLFAIAGLVLGVFMLILDFDFVEQGVAAGIDERESWRAAFALTVSLVWIYTNLLRILAIFSQD